MQFVCYLNMSALSAFPTSRYFASNIAEHDGTITAFLVEFCLVMCEIVAREGSKSLVAISALV